MAHGAGARIVRGAARLLLALTVALASIGTNASIAAPAPFDRTIPHNEVASSALDSRLAGAPAAAAPVDQLAQGSSVFSIGPFLDQSAIGMPLAGLEAAAAAPDSTEVASPTWRRHPALPRPAGTSVAERQTPTAAAVPTAVSTCGIDPTAAPELIALARALKNDPDLIYQYVHDNIEYTPIGGALKGPLGTLIDQRGTAYDQAALMVTLLRQAAIANPAISNVRYELGTIQLNLAQLQNFYGVDNNANSLGSVLGSGGINATIFVDGSGHLVSASIDHVWVKVNLGGTDYAFDPSFKTYTRTNAIDLASAMGYSRSTLLADALNGATTTSSSIRGVNRTNVRGDLQSFATNLANFIRTNSPAASVADIIGGKSIVPTTGTLRQANLPYATGTPTDNASLPAGFHPTLGITLPGAVTVTCNADDLYGHRMSLFFNAAHQPVLRVDGSTLSTGSAGTLGSQMQIGTDINVPFFTFASSSTSLNVTVGGSFLIGNGWDQVTRGMVEKHRALLTQARALNADPTSEPVLGESLAVLGYTWLAEVAGQQQLTDQLLTTTTEYFYGIGIVGIATGGSTTSPFVDLPLNFTNTPTRINGSQTGETPNSLAAFFDGSGVASGFESGVLEQSQAQIPNFVAASTTRLLDTGLLNNDTIFDINNGAVPGDDANFYFNTLRPQMAPNYTAGDLASIDGYVNGNFRVIAPMHGRIAVGNWTGVGFKTISPDGTQLGEIISGGLHGGFGGVNDPANLFVRSTDGTLTPAYDSSGHLIGDPIDRVTGAFRYEHEDLSIGSASFPFGLGFKRTYLSSSQLQSGPVGNGWTHNFAITAQVDSDGFEGMGGTTTLSGSPVNASSAIAALFVSSDLLNGFIGPTQQNLNLIVVESAVNRWFVDQLTGNVVIVSQAGASEHFVRLADGTTYGPPLGSGTLLTRAPNGTFRYATKDGLQLAFNLDGTLGTWANAAGMSVTFSYTSGALTSVRNSLGRQLTLGYTGSLISSISDGTGRSVTYTYTGGNLTSFQDAVGQPTRFVYDTSGTYDTAGHLTQIFYPAHPSSPFVTNAYDPLGRVSSQWDGTGHLTQAYIAGSRTELLDPDQNRQVWMLDQRGLVLRHIDDAGAPPHLNLTTIFTYDGLTRLIQTTMPEGNAVANTYDDQANVLTERQIPKTGSGLAPLVQTYTYVKPDAAFPNFSRQRTQTDPLGHTTTFGYDSATGSLLTIDQPAGNGGAPHQSFTYDANGLLLTGTDPDGKVTRHTYDALANRQSTTDDFGVGRLNLLTSYTYDSVGNLASTTDPRGNTSMMTFDAQRRLTQVSGPSSVVFVTAYTYDEDGNTRQTQRTSDTPGVPQTTAYTYSVTGKVLRATDHAGNDTVYTYDNLDRVASVTDPEGRVTSYTYDALSRPFQTFNTAIQAQPLEQRTYTPNGKVQTLTNARGNATTYQYDGFDRLSRTQFPDTSTETLTYDMGSSILSRTTRGGQTLTFSYDALKRVTTKAPQGEPTVIYSYDLAGRTTSASDAGGTFTFGYDTAGRNTSAMRPDGRQVSSQYDVAGNRTRETWPDGYFVTYDYDALNRVTDVRENGTQLLAHYTYDNLSRRTSLTYGNGATVNYSYSPNDDQTGLTQHFNASTSTSFTYTYNKVHQRTGDTVSDTNYVRRIAASSNTSYTSNTADEYTAVGGTSFTYDGNGNLTHDATFTYAYDTENHLTNATIPGHSATYAYDPLGRRLSKTVDGTVTNFLSDGDREIAEYNGSGTLLQRFVYGPGLTEPIAAVSPSGAHTYNHQDVLGSVIALSSDAGNVTASFAYGAYGESASVGGSAFRFAGLRFDLETGLYYARGRFYSPNLGRFLQADPIGYDGGLNLYRYVNNDPLNRVDPKGLAGSPINLRGPDYVTVTVDIPIPNPWTDLLLGVAIGATYDRYGNVYFTLGGYVGTPGRGVSVVAGWILQGTTPSESQLTNFITSWSVSGGAGYWGGGGFTWGNVGGTSLSDFSVELGFYSPGATLSGTYTWQLPFKLWGW